MVTQSWETQWEGFEKVLIQQDINYISKQTSSRLFSLRQTKNNPPRGEFSPLPFWWGKCWLAQFNMQIYRAQKATTPENICSRARTNYMREKNI